MKSELAYSQLAQAVIGQALECFSKEGLKDDDLAITVGLSDGGMWNFSDFHGEVKIYPASVVKLFYLVAAYQWIADQRLERSPELERALRDMIIGSSNDATSYVLDLLTGTTSGPELAEEEMSVWMKKRNLVNEYFSGLGYKHINVNQKPWGDGPYGREKVFLGTNYENRNMLTTNATAELFSKIVDGLAVDKDSSNEMLTFLERDYTKICDDPDDQASGFSAKCGLPEGSKLWSKAGWTSTARHDAACIELPCGKKIILVAFTINHAKQYELIPYICGEILRRV